jgi:hypothetical protein
MAHLGGELEILPGPVKTHNDLCRRGLSHKGQGQNKLQAIDLPEVEREPKELPTLARFREVAIDELPIIIDYVHVLTFSNKTDPELHNCWCIYKQLPCRAPFSPLDPKVSHDAE